MIKKRILILTLTFLFLVSTTGLPITYHLCQMMDKKSLSECEMCMADEVKAESSCCSEEFSDYLVTLSSENPICCQDEFVYNKIEDDFILSKTDVQLILTSEVLPQVIAVILHSVDFSFEGSFYCDSSPPFLINPEIHITNSVLLI
ncbi:MAG: hypothetical protein OQK57_03350 [Ignavibacteriaceae bacterium]|nr:hypothetical protein [Ignavibacteriaceae bacterium]